MRYVPAISRLTSLFRGRIDRAEAEHPLAWLRDPDRSEGLANAFQDGHTLIVFAHQDDDLLWMLPFWPAAAKFILAAYPASQLAECLARNLPPQLNYADRWHPAWGTIDNDLFAEIFTDRCKRAPIVNLGTITAHLRPFFTPDIRRVVTHNNWGEYGHVEHRVVNAAVRKLAVDSGIDVWALGARVVMGAPDQSGYVDVSKSTGLPIIEGYFDGTLFRTVREKYLETVPRASTAELSEKFRQWSPSLWTWSDAPSAFPQGWWPFVELVSRGIDLTASNAAVEQLVEIVPIINQCTTMPILPGH